VDARSRLIPFPALFGLLVGGGVLAWLVLRVGLTPVRSAAASLGWRGFAIIITFHCGQIVAMGYAWWLLGPGQARWPAFVLSRFARDSAAEALPLSQIGGFVVGARALVLGGAPALFAAASTLVDLSVELVAKLPYTLLGAALLLWPIVAGGQTPRSDLFAGLLGLVAVLLPAAALLTMLGRATGWVERMATALARRLGSAWPFTPGALRQEISQIYARRRAICGAFAIHGISWLLSGVELWLTLRLMHQGLALAPAIVIDSLLNGLRSFAFVIPGALGVQEAGYMALGALFALPPDVAIALSLLRRGRDLGIGIPGVLIWQFIEGRRLHRLWRAPLS
jgi:putative membrane protein